MKILLAICIVLLLGFCKTRVKPGPITLKEFSDASNLPKDSLAFYFPAGVFSDKPKADSFVQNWFSSALYNFKEPVLFQNYVGHDIYRFLWLRSFHRPVVFTLNHTDRTVWLTTKMLDRQPPFYENRIAGVPKKEIQVYIEKGYSVDKKDSDLLVRIADRKANIIYNKTTPLSEQQWDEFQGLLARARFWKLPASIDHGDTDGSEWVIEAHLNGKYHFVDYFSPYKNDYQKAGLFLIKLSGLKEEVY